MHYRIRSLSRPNGVSKQTTPAPGTGVSIGNSAAPSPHKEVKAASKRIARTLDQIVVRTTIGYRLAKAIFYRLAALVSFSARKLGRDDPVTCDYSVPWVSLAYSLGPLAFTIDEDVEVFGLNAVSIGLLDRGGFTAKRWLSIEP